MRSSSESGIGSCGDSYASGPSGIESVPWQWLWNDTEIPYLKVEQQVREEDGRSRIELTLHDAWVWDMYRQSRFVTTVRVVTYKDVNVEELPKKEI